MTAAEEGASDLLNWIIDDLYDLVTGTKESEFKALVAAYEENGLDRKKATLSALGDRGKELGLDTLGGFLSGLFLSGAKGGYNAAEFNRMGKAAFETGSYGDYISLGLLADRDTEACRYAEEIRAKLNAGREVTNIEMGQLAAAVYADALGVGEKRAAEEAVQILAAAGMDTQRNPEGGLTPERNRGIVGVQEQADRKGVTHGTGEEETRAIVGKEPAVPGEMEEEPGGVREASPGRTGTDPQQSAGIVRQSNTQRFNRIKSFSIAIFGDGSVFPPMKRDPASRNGAESLMK